MDFVSGVLVGFVGLFAFATLSIWFWLIAAVSFGWLIYLTEESENFFLAVVLVAVFAWLMASANEFSITANPLLILKWFGVYMAVGAGWSFLKWLSFLFKTKDELKRLKRKYLSKLTDTEVREALVADVDGYHDSNGKFEKAAFPKFAEFLKDNSYLGYQTFKLPSDVIPSVTQYYGKLTSWIVWWPVSAFWTILNDPIRRIAQQLVNVFRSLYERMAAAVFSSEV